MLRNVVGLTGKLLHSDNFGQWSTIPGIPKSKLIVSSLGYTRLQVKPGMPLGPPIMRPQDEDGYRCIKINKRAFRNSHIVLCAFIGGKPTEKHTADHIAKYKGDWFKERGDDRIDNLRWALPVLQRSNQVVLAERNDSDSLNNEAQDDLVVNGVTEIWKSVTSALKVSSHGRICKRRKSHWGMRRTPKPAKTKRYAYVESYKDVFSVHGLVWSFFGSRKLNPGETVDHIDRDRSNNCISNLRPATKSTQSRNQKCQRKQTMLMRSVEGRPGKDAEWRRWSSQLEAASTLNAELKQSPAFTQPNISQAARTGVKHCGWEWRFVVG